LIDIDKAVNLMNQLKQKKGGSMSDYLSTDMT
jgi:hypothetical protein